MLLGFNPKASGPSNVAFLAPFGEIFDSSVTVDDSPDGSFTLDDTGSDEQHFECYDVDGVDCPNKEPAFPFHPPCYWILQRRLSNYFSGVTTIDKDVLYGVMRSLTATVSFLDIDYGDLEKDFTCVRFWHSYAGEEVYAANPGLVEGLEGIIQEMMATGYFHLPKHMELDLSYSVQKDPFKSLPFDILVSIAEMLEDPECFMNWARASWSIHTFLRSAQNSFWKRTIRMQMQWFFELDRFLEDDKLCHGSSMRAVFLWAAGGSKLRLGMKGGDFLRLANRRRIWTSPCKDLIDRYCKILPRHLLGEGGDFGYNKEYSSEEE
ncbi:hypothetical protein V495_05479 [Pseudogymnoascus sp. VKM F-4514 (FW-929)]|nr:hypothetical protein V495_05479 [Pseudogymnoascus sp. VKM F-4514 (FW-929)]KFY58820.1 hypothetical protein V497_04641 [Pseudogymnoascus sp. VKM F-4516 (FW-969)]